MSYGRRTAEVPETLTMSLTTEAWICPSVGEKLALGTVELAPLESTQVEINMTHCGLCHTDIHMKNNDWGTSDFPLVAGHEGVGTVAAMGHRVQTFKKGDVVGVGWIRDSCGHCQKCLAGRENICEKGYQGTFLSQGSGVWGKKDCRLEGCFAKVMRVESRFVFKIPKGLDIEKVGPLMCAGVTVWDPICDYVKPGTKVGVRSLGGLGHMAVQLATAVGAEVTAISRGSDKKERIMELGAKHYLATSDKEALAAAAGSLDLIIDTCPYESEKVENLQSWMSLLKFGGTLCKVGIPNAGFQFGYIPLIFCHYKIAGSVVCGSLYTRNMLDVVAETNVHSDVELRPFDQINECMDELANGTNEHFRYVLKW